jgi:hypothetical protein
LLERQPEVQVTVPLSDFVDDEGSRIGPIVDEPQAGPVAARLEGIV